MGVQATFRNNTRNQMTIDFMVKRFCIFNNEFIPVTFKNNSGLSITAQGAIFVVRDTTTADQVLPAYGYLSGAGAVAAPALTGSTTGGTLAATTYYIKQTALNAIGESIGSAEASVATTGSTSSIAVVGAVVAGATSYNTYIGTSAAGESHYFNSDTPNITITTTAGTAATVPTADTTGNLANVIGILLMDGQVTLANGSTLGGSMVISGVIDSTMLVYPLNTTPDTTVGNKAFKDVVNGLGFKLDQSTSENTKFDN